ncbi:TonB-dependent receptor domain-containing protein [Sphingobacterium spiritivorum]|uniref:TonB-dependent receptor domain-containing protein n=1 Tax=Sphingobacterium spiritivorum TaxID=258 RepID=UPI003DA6B254
MKNLYRLLLIIPLAIGISQHTFAQINISGKIRNSNDSPVSSAVVTLYQGKGAGKMITAGATDENGEFHLTSDKGSYLLKVTFLQELLYQKEITVEKQLDLGLITVEKDGKSKELAEIEIRKYKPTVVFRNGKLEFSPSVVETGSVLEIMKIAPTVQIQEEQINLLGKTGTEIRINGRKIHMTGEQLTSYLATLSANMLEKLEIVHNPGAEYDADAKGGVINIVLKELKEKGVNASTYVTQTKSKYANTSLGGNFNMLAGKWQTWGSAGIDKGKNWTYGTNDIFYTSGLWQDKNEQINRQKSLSATAGIEFVPDSNNAINASFSYYKGPSTGEEYNQSFIYNIQKILDSTLRTTGTNPQDYSNFSYNVNYVHTFGKSKRKLTFDYAQVSTLFDREQDFTNSVIKDGNATQTQRFFSGNNQNVAVQTANLALDLPNKIVNMNVGGKLIFNKNQNETSFYEFVNNNWDASEDKFDNFKYKERIQALYFQGNKTIGKWELQGGLRMEATQTEGSSLTNGQITKRNYTKFFPSFSASFNKDDNNTFNLSYGKKIQRPEFSWVNPFAWYTNAYEYSHGNPSLQPYFSNDLTFMYVLKQKWTFYASYYSTRNVYAEYMKIDTTTGQRESRVDNFVNQDILSLYASTDFNLWKRWKMSPELAFQAHKRGSDLALIDDTSGFNVNAGLYQQIQVLPDNKLVLTLNSSYSSPSNASVLETKARFVQHAGITYQAVKDTLQISLNGNDLFKSAAFQYDAYVNDIRRTRYKYSNSQQVSMTVRYNFKKGKKREINRSNANDDEMRRAG